MNHAGVRSRARHAVDSVALMAREGARFGLRIAIDATMRELASSPAFFRLVDDVVQYLVHNADVRSLIHEQSAGFVDDAVHDLRVEAARVDTALDRAVYSLRKRLMRRRR